MICQVRDEGREVALTNAKFSDILAVIQIWIHKDREICYTNPVDPAEYVKIMENEND